MNAAKPRFGAEALLKLLPHSVPLRGGALTHSQRALLDDVLFLEAWQAGHVPWLGAIVRVRQIRRAHPGLAAEGRPAKAQGGAKG